tara:strand:- start:142 stop:513 length:372 start_codon:yes stop_codon:yes gene_type:complete
MQSLEVRSLVSGKKLFWESSELVALKMIRDRLYSFYSLTEKNLDNMSKMMILKELKSLSTYTEDLIRFVSKEIDKLIERDAKVNKICSHCQSDQIIVCDPCMDKWSKELDEKIKETHDSIHSK